MATYELIIGDKNLSSWSLRAWLLLRQFNLPFEETMIHLDQPDTRAKILAHSPAGRVPVLKAGDLTLWDSLAIVEFIAEQHGDLAIWPCDAPRRARARVMAAEMHSGFEALRRDLDFDVQSPSPHKTLGVEVVDDIARICDIWRQARHDHSDDDDEFLFGPFCAADAMFAPVAIRFQLYDVALDPTCQAYVAAVLGLSAVQEWLAAARLEKPLFG
jgi:glutathione S-transferase